MSNHPPAAQTTQERVLAYIKKEIHEKGYPPSVREIGDALDLRSTSTVHGHLVRLERKGLLRRDLNKTRALEILGDPAFDRTREAPTPVPVLGRVAAGTPILALEDAEAFVPLPREMLPGSGDHFLLIIKGLSMVNAGILDGDYVIVHKQNDANNGDIVIAMIEDEATCKRFYRENGRFRLQPENPDMEPIYTRQADILGKVVGLYRMF